MNQNEKETAKRIQTLAVCGCLCLLAVGAGVTYRALDRGTAAQPQLEPNPQPVTATQTPTLDTRLRRNPPLPQKRNPKRSRQNQHLLTL